MGIVFVALAWRWWSSPRGNAETDATAWALAITSTLVCNLYVGIYEATLLVISILLFTQVRYTLADQASKAMNNAYKNLLVWLYVAPWVSQWLAKSIGAQLLTAVILALGIYQWFFIQKMSEKTISKGVYEASTLRTS